MIRPRFVGRANIAIMSAVEPKPPHMVVAIGLMADMLAFIGVRTATSSECQSAMCFVIRNIIIRLAKIRMIFW